MTESQETRGSSTAPEPLSNRFYGKTNHTRSVTCSYLRGAGDLGFRRGENESISFLLSQGACFCNNSPIMSTDLKKVSFQPNPSMLF
jgi:hypothetical protein